MYYLKKIYIYSKIYHNVLSRKNYLNQNGKVLQIKPFNSKTNIFF